MQLAKKPKAISTNKYCNNFSSAKKVHAGVPQGSNYRPLLFNLYINGSMLFLTDTFLSNYADDNRLSSIGNDGDIIKNLPRKDFRALTKWFSENYMKLNQKKRHYMCIGKNTEDNKFEFDLITCF